MTTRNKSQTSPKKSTTKKSEKEQTQQKTTKKAKKEGVKKSADKQVQKSTTAKSRREVPQLTRLPLLWRFETKVQTVGLWIDENVWTSNDRGDVYCLSPEGEELKHLQLPGVSFTCVADEAWHYAGCGDGKVYDISGRTPHAMYEVGNANIGWMEIFQGSLCVSDLNGVVAVFGYEGELKWKKKVRKGGEGWVLRTDNSGLYHGCEGGLRRFTWKGRVAWKNTEVGDVRFAAMDENEIVCTGGYQTRAGQTKLYVVSKKTGEIRFSRKLSSKIKGFMSNGAEACGIGYDSDGKRKFYAACGGVLFAFDDKGRALWQAKVTKGPICNMMHLGDRAYIVTQFGRTACIDLSEKKIARAIRGKVDKEKERKASTKRKTKAKKLETTTDVSSGVVLEVVKIKSALRVRVVSDGYNPDWFCQFPKVLREEGAKFVVDEVREATQGGFYRTLGDIKRLV